MANLKNLIVQGETVFLNDVYITKNVKITDGQEIEAPHYKLKDEGYNYIINSKDNIAIHSQSDGDSYLVIEYPTWNTVFSCKLDIYSINGIITYYIFVDGATSNTNNIQAYCIGSGNDNPYEDLTIRFRAATIGGASPKGQIILSNKITGNPSTAQPVEWGNNIVRAVLSNIMTTDESETNVSLEFTNDILSGNSLDRNAYLSLVDPHN